MMDLITFKNNQIEALQKELAKVREHNIQLSTWVFEACDPDTPQEYKDVIVRESTELY